MKIFLKNKFISIILLFLLLFLSLFFIPKTQYFISRLILSHELSILPNLIVKKLNKKNELNLYKKNNKKIAAKVFNQYVYDHAKPVKLNLDDGASWKLLHGSIWCDGVSDILNRMLEVINVRAYLVWLHNDKMQTPHALSMVDFLDQKLVNGRNSSLDKMTLYIFDPQNNYNPINLKNEFVNIRYITENEQEFKHMIKLDSDGKKLNLLKNNLAQLWDQNTFGDQNSIIRNFSKKVVKFFPDIIFEKLIKFSIFINPKLENNYKQFLLARFEHITFNYKTAQKKYKILIDKKIFIEDSKFWFDKLMLKI